MPADLQTQLEALGEILLDLAPPLSTAEVKHAPASGELALDDVFTSDFIRHGQPSRRPRWLAVAAAVLVVGAGSALVIGRSSRDVSPAEFSLLPASPSAIPAPERTNDVATTTSADESTHVTLTPATPTPATTTNPFETTTTDLATTTTPPVPDLGFTPLALSSPPAGYTFDWARYADSDGGRLGFVRYVGGEGQPALVLLIRALPDFFDQLLQIGRQTWEVNGHTFINDNQGDTCATDVCSIGVQWDEQTAVSMMWGGESIDPLPATSTIDSLVAIAPLLAETDAALFEPGPVQPDAYGLEVDKAGLLPALVVAGQNAGNPAVTEDSGTGLDLWTNIPSRIALALGDGRMLVEPIDGNSPHLLTGSLGRLGAITPVPLWPDAVPFSHHIQDTAVLDGRIWLLYTETTPAGCTSTPCTMTVDIAPVDDLAGSKVVATLDDAADIRASTRLTLSSRGNILGVIQRTEPVWFAAIFDPVSGTSAVGTSNGTTPSLYAVDVSGLAEAQILAGALIVDGNDDSGRRTIPFPDGFSAENTVGLDIAATNDAATQGALALSAADGTIAIIDLADGSVTVLRERTGLATFD